MKQLFLILILGLGLFSLSTLDYNPITVGLEKIESVRASLANVIYVDNPPVEAIIDEPVIVETSRVGQTVDIAFVGDMMFDRHIRRLAEGQSEDYPNPYDFLLQKITPTFKSLDMVVANLEGPITSYETRASYDQADPNHYVFTFHPSVADTLKKNNILAVSLANNHIMNFGTEGIEQTTRFLDEKGIGYFGAPSDSTPFIKEINGIKIGFVGFNQFLSPSQSAGMAIEAIKQMEVDFIAVFAHWGEEYVEKPNQRQIELAHSFVDAGADIVIGAHPHVIQQKEIYKNKIIYYSLGNFVFDQYFEEDVRCGAMIIVKIIPEENPRYTIQEFSTYLGGNGQTALSQCKEKVPFLAS